MSLWNKLHAPTERYLKGGNTTLQCHVQPKLAGGLERVLVVHVLGIIIQIDFHIFQRGRYTKVSRPKTPLGSALKDVLGAIHLSGYPTGFSEKPCQHSGALLTV